METFLTYLGISVALIGPFVAHKMFPNTAKAIRPKPISAYVPHHIDQYGDIVMIKKIKTKA